MTHWCFIALALGAIFFIRWLRLHESGVLVRNQRSPPPPPPIPIAVLGVLVTTKELFYGGRMISTIEKVLADESITIEGLAARLDVALDRPSFLHWGERRPTVLVEIIATTEHRVVQKIVQTIWNAGFDALLRRLEDGSRTRRAAE